MPAYYPLPHEPTAGAKADAKKVGMVVKEVTFVGPFAGTVDWELEVPTEVTSVTLARWFLSHIGSKAEFGDKMWEGPIMSTSDAMAFLRFIGYY